MQLDKLLMEYGKLSGNSIKITLVDLPVYWTERCARSQSWTPQPDLSRNLYLENNACCLNNYVRTTRGANISEMVHNRDIIHT